MPVISDTDKQGTVEETPGLQPRTANSVSRHWIVAMAALAVVAGGLPFCFLPRAERRDGSEGAADVLCHTCGTRSRGRGSCVVRQCAGLHQRSNLCTNQRISKEVVCGHRCARDRGATSGRD